MSEIEVEIEIEEDGAGCRVDELCAHGRGLKARYGQSQPERGFQLLASSSQENSAAYGAND